MSMADQQVEINPEQVQRATTHPRAVGSPLPRGGHRAMLAEIHNDPQPVIPPPPGRALISGEPNTNSSDPASGMHRALNALRAAVPYVQRLLPLLDGNIVAAVTNVFSHASPKPEPPVNLAPLHNSVSELQIQNRELRDQVTEQNVSLRKVEDQLELVREATDRNTLEQQELIEDLRSVGRKVNVIAFVALAMLAISLLLNLILYLHIQRVLP